MLRVLNFAHGTFYMLGAYSAYQIVQWLGAGPVNFWVAALGAAAAVALLGGIVERFLFQRLYGKEELYQLLFTYALVLILGDVAKIIWGTQQKSITRPPGLTGAMSLFGATLPYYNLFIILLGPAIALGFWFALQRTRAGRFIRAAALDRETLGALGVNVKALYTGVFVLASFLGGLGGVVERFLFRHLYGKEELYQLLFTYSLVLILGDVAKIIWGTQQKSVGRPPGLTGSFTVAGITVPHYNLFILLLAPSIALAFWFVLQRTRAGRFIRAAALDRESLGALGVNVSALYTGVFVLASFLGGLGGALITPMRAIVPGMDTDVIVDAFVVVVIGGLGSFWGTFLGALIYGQVLSFGILFFPRFSIFAIFALMATVLVIRPWGLLGRPLK